MIIRSFTLKAESIFLTIWGLSKFILSVYTKTEYFLYDKEFEDAYNQTIDHVNAVLDSV